MIPTCDQGMANRGGKVLLGLWSDDKLSLVQIAGTRTSEELNSKKKNADHEDQSGRCATSFVRLTLMPAAHERD
jgi:hypothetical protein